MEQLTTEKFKELLPFCCDRETSYDPSGWSEKNPLWGHCAVVSVLAHNFFGGQVIMSRGTKHYWNILPDGRTEDFTEGQFQGNAVSLTDGRRITNSVLFLRIKQSKRYKLLMLRLIKALCGSNPIFNDPIYQRCFFAALDSPCQKMKFGCVILQNGKIIYQSCNKTITPLKSLCEPRCIRFSIQSRTESMLGACGHAEELGLWEIARKNIALSECELYVAGFYPPGIPWFKQAAEHTCLRCAVQVYHAGLTAIYFPVIDQWAGISPEEAVKTALAYARGEKKTS